MKKGKRTKKELAEFPCRLREIRKEQGKSVVGLAHETGVAADKIHYIELKRGEGAPSTHIKLAKALGVSMDEYFGFPTLQSDSDKKPEIIQSDYAVTIEELAPPPRSELNIKRIHLAARKAVDLTRYLDPRRPLFIYLDQAQCKIWIGQTEHLLQVGGHLGISVPSKIRIENVTPVPLSLLAIQP